MAKPFESRIQDLVYNVEVGIGLRLIKTGLYVLFVLLMMVIYTSNQFKGLRTAEAMEYAQLGRNLALSNTLTTQIIRPSSMWYLTKHSANHKPNVKNHPDILHPPLYPAALAAGFKISSPSFEMAPSASSFKPEKTIIIPISMFFTALAGLLLYLMARNMFDTKVALLGTTLFFLSDTVWASAISGLPTSMVMFFGVLTFYCTNLVITNYQDGRTFIAWGIPLLIAGITLTLAFLTQYAAAVLLPGILLITGIGLRKKGWIALLLLILLFLAGITPWIIRNINVSGGPFGLAPYAFFEQSGAFPGNAFDSTLAPNFNDETMKTNTQIKFNTNLKKFYNTGFRNLGDGFLFCLFITSFFYRFLRSSVHLMRWGIALSALLLLITASFFGDTSMRLMLAFWPIAIMYACAFFFLLLDRLNFSLKISNIGVIAALIITSILPLIFTLMPPRASVPYPPYFPPFINHVSKFLNQNELMCTDMPWATAWYANQNSLLLPNTLDEFYDINDYFSRVSGLYFTSLTRDRAYMTELQNGIYRTWWPILQGRIPNDFPLPVGFPLNNFEQMFLTDSRRWEK